MEDKHKSFINFKENLDDPTSIKSIETIPNNSESESHSSTVNLKSDNQPLKNAFKEFEENFIESINMVKDLIDILKKKEDEILV